MAIFQLFSSVQGTGSSPTGPDPENRVGDQNTEGSGRSVSSGLQMPGELGALSCKNKTTLVNFPRCFFFKMSFNCTSRDELIVRVDSLILWKIMRRMPPSSQKIKVRTFPTNFCNRNFFGPG